MIRLRELLQQIIEDRTTSPQGILAKRSGLQRKKGFGNYGPAGQPYITHRSLRGQLKPVTPHRIGQKAPFSGKPEPRIRFPGQPKTPAEE